MAGLHLDMDERLCRLLFEAGVRHARRAEDEPELAESASAPCAMACTLFVEQFYADRFGLSPEDAARVEEAIGRNDYADLERAYWSGWRFNLEGGGETV